MKRSARVHALLAAAFLTAPTLAAQRPGGVEVGAFGSLGSFTPRFDLQVAPGRQILFRTDREALVLYGVTFETGRSRLEAESSGVLDQVAASLVANPGVRIEIAGYTDSTGSTARNTRLSAALSRASRGGAGPDADQGRRAG